jgi:hypothetical protein
MKFKQFSKISLVIATAFAFTFTSCNDDSGDDTVDPVEENVVYHSGTVSADETWTASKMHILEDRVIVPSGVTLTIEPGTIIKGEAGSGANASALVVARGAKIMAEGTADKPIIFTTIADEIEIGQKFGPNLDPQRHRGYWGGVIILGAAPTSPKTGATAQIEGIPGDIAEGNYGGSEVADNSGVFTYVSIRHGGTLIGEGNEINGLTLGGVGNGTTIHHIEVVGNVDDGIEWFGGSVDGNDLCVINQGDDAYDIDQAYSGTITNIVYVAGADSDHALEIDGPEGSENSTGAFTLKNGSFKGNAASGEFADFRSKARGEVSDCYFWSFNENADVELDEDVVSTNFNSDVLFIANNNFNSTAWELDGDGEPTGSTVTWSMVTAIFADKSDNGDATASDAKFVANSNALVTAKAGGANVTELKGWTLADHLGLLSDF